jgi:hypothetical protein
MNATEPSQFWPWIKAVARLLEHLNVTDHGAATIDCPR